MTATVAEEGLALIEALEAARTCMYEPDQDLPEQLTGTASALRKNAGAKSTPPWNAQAAAAYFDSAQSVRLLEQELTIEVTGHTPRPRGGSHENTIMAIHMITRLTTDDTAARQLRHIRTPCDQLPARDTQERPTPIRLTADAEKPPLCPYCRTPQLRLFQRSGRVVCFYPNCTDHDGNRAAASLTRNHLDGTPMLIGDDGTTW